MSAKFPTGFRTNVCVGQMSVSDKCPCRTNVRLPTRSTEVVAEKRKIDFGKLQNGIYYLEHITRYPRHLRENPRRHRQGSYRQGSYRQGSYRDCA